MEDRIVTRSPALPPFTPSWHHRAVVLEAASGPARRAALQQWLDEAARDGAATWLLGCAFEEGGVWAGLAALLHDLVPRIQERAPHLLERHSYELCLTLPPLWRTLSVRNPSLTETASEEEKVRNYPIDRAYRSLHGLIDLLAAWHELSGGGAWVIACDHYDRANALVQRFFAELLRRRGRQMGLTLLLATDPGASEAAVSRIPPEQRAATVCLDLAPAPPDRVTEQRAIPEQWAAEARAIEQRIAQDPYAREMELPRLIHCLERSGADPAVVLRLQVEAMHLYVHRGLYEAAAAYAPSVEARLDYLYATDPALHDLAVNSLYFCYVPLGEAERAYRVVKEEMIDRTDDPTYLPRIYYLMAMLHARFLPAIDLVQAEAYLDVAMTILRDLPGDALELDRRAFLTVFTINGLAFVRLRQRRPQEAVALCRAGIAILDEHLRPDQHRLHRSVLVYNIAQVYAQIGPFDEALAHFDATMAMDPHYSEYYNERGSVYFKLGRLDEAEGDYQQAIALSPPYQEVWTNLGQCYRAMERMADAVAAYSRALDLDPSVGLALVGRAEAHAALGDTPAALADYGAALRASPKEAMIYAGRAVVLYEAGQVQAALADLDTAIALAPDEADYYQNRAVALADLGRVDEALADLWTYLRLAPDADDRAEVQERVARLIGAPSTGRDAAPALNGA